MNNTLLPFSIRISKLRHRGKLIELIKTTGQITDFYFGPGSCLFLPVHPRGHCVTVTVNAILVTCATALGYHNSVRPHSMGLSDRLTPTSGTLALRKGVPTFRTMCSTVSAWLKSSESAA